jgi:hypothetical protein
MNYQYPLVPTQQPGQPIGDKNRITSMALKRDVCAGVGKDRGEVVRVWWTYN